MRFLAALALALPLCAQPKPQYEIYAIRYATIPGFAVSQLVAGALARLGLKPEDITDLIITHMHWPPARR
jgi:glyoxylase-like metal-dependent hydrolase (beta-lactamase superfamily II)